MTISTSDIRDRARQAVKRVVDRSGLDKFPITINVDKVVLEGDGHATGDLAKLEQRLLAAIAHSQESLMAVLDALRAAQGETKALLAAAAAAIEEINTDLADLLARLANSQPGSQEVLDATAEANEIKATLSATVDALRAAAGQHTPGEVTPPVDPPPPPVDPPPPPPDGEVVEP